jgi:lipopolysaccharide biosynthesis glycosyltransferase
MTLVFTICSNNYLAQAITLGQTLLTHNPHYIFKIGLVDKRIPQIGYEDIPFEIVEVESIGIAAFNEMFKRYSITELNTAVKPFYFKYFFNSIPQINSIIYLDPDILVYRPFTELEAVLEEKEIVIAPHFITPINDDKIQSENDFLNTGLYNLGFLVLKKGEESQKLLEWWAKRLETKAYIDLGNGLFTDQIWINFAPLFFDNVEIFKNPGYNMAYWNMHERNLNIKNEVISKEQPYPLVFFHFSGYDPLKPKILSKYQNRFSFENRKDIVDLFNDYTEKLFTNGYAAFINYHCYYTIEKQRMDLEDYIAFKSSIPIYKRIIRGIILRMIKFFRMDIDYYIH